MCNWISRVAHLAGYDEFFTRKSQQMPECQCFEMQYLQHETVQSRNLGDFLAVAIVTQQLSHATKSCYTFEVSIQYTFLLYWMDGWSSHCLQYNTHTHIYIYIYYIILDGWPSNIDYIGRRKSYWTRRIRVQYNLSESNIIYIGRSTIQY